MLTFLPSAHCRIGQSESQNGVFRPSRRQPSQFIISAVISTPFSFDHSAATFFRSSELFSTVAFLASQDSQSSPQNAIKFFIYLPSFRFFLGLPCLSAGRAFQPSLTLFPKCWFRQAQSTFWNFGLPCPKLYVRKVRYANFAHYRVFALQKLAVYSQICKFSSRILIPSSTLCPSISCIFWNLYFLCRLSRTLRWASFLCRRMKIACALLAAAPSLLGV